MRSKILVKKNRFYQETKPEDSQSILVRSQNGTRAAAPRQLSLLPKGHTNVASNETTSTNRSGRTTSTNGSGRVASTGASMSPMSTGAARSGGGGGGSTY